MTTTHRQPAWTLIVDGIDITAMIERRLISLTLTDNRGFESDQLDVTLDDADGKLSLPARGAIVKLALGWSGSPLVDKGLYTVDEIEHRGAPDQLTFRARSVDLRGGLTTQMERSFHRVTRGHIVRTIADENELDPLVAPDLDAEFIEHLDQTNESSANLLTRLARMFDAIASVKNGRLLFLHAGEGKSASGKPLPVATIVRQDGDQHQFSLAERENYTAVRATYYDTHKGEKGEELWGKEEEAEAKGMKKPVASPAAESLPMLKTLPGKFKSRKLALRACAKAWKALKNKSGVDGYKASYDDRINKTSGEVSYGRTDEQQKHTSALKLSERDAKKIYGPAEKKSEFDHGADNVKTIRHVYANKENAKRAARSEYLKLGRGTASFSISLADGRAELFPEVPVEVRGFKPAIDSTEWILSRVVHRITDGGFVTSLELEILATVL